MKNVFVILFGSALLMGTVVAAQAKRDSLQGVWQTVEVTITGPGARTIAIPQPRPNLVIVTGKYYSRVEVHAEGPRQVLADAAKATADELRAVWGPFVGEAGTYTIEGNVITMHPIAAKNPAAMAAGAFSTYAVKLDGNTMWVTALKDQNGPVANPVTVKAVRLE